MSSLVDARLESNSKLRINFDGGNLSSDTGLFLLKEFIHKVGLDDIVEDNFKTNDSAKYRYHKDNENLFQEIYQTIAGYFQDDDEFIKDPVFNTLLEQQQQNSKC